MPRFSWLFNATQAPFKNAKEKPRETGDQEGELKTDTNGKESTRIDTNPSIEDLTASDDPPSWLTWLRKAADLQRKSRHSFYIDPPVINIWNNDNPLHSSSSSSSTIPNISGSKPDLQRSTTDPASPKKVIKSKSTEPLYDPSLASEYNKAILAYISTGTVPKPKSSPKRKKSSKQQQQKTVRFELEATTKKKEEPAPKLNMQNSRIIFQSPQLTVILTPPEGETQNYSTSAGLIEGGGGRKMPARYKSTRERERGGEKRNPFLSIRNYRLGNGSVDGIHTSNTNTDGMTRNFPNQSLPNLACTPFNPGHYHTFNPNLNSAQNPRFSTSSIDPNVSTAQNPRFSISSQNPTLPHAQNHLAPSNLTLTSPTQYNPKLLTPPPQSLLDARRIKKQNEIRELKDVREFIIEVLNREGGQLKKRIRGKIMGLYGIGDGDLEGDLGGGIKAGHDGKRGREEAEDVNGNGNLSGTKKVDEGVDFGVDSCEKEDLKSLEMVFRGRFSGSWDTGSMRGRVSV